MAVGHKVVDHKVVEMMVDHKEVVGHKVVVGHMEVFVGHMVLDYID